LADVVLPSVADIFSILDQGEEKEECSEWQRSL